MILLYTGFEAYDRALSIFKSFAHWQNYVNQTQKLLEPESI
jgi:hypothetical protein